MLVIDAIQWYRLHIGHIVKKVNTLNVYVFILDSVGWNSIVNWLHYNFLLYADVYQPDRGQRGVLMPTHVWKLSVVAPGSGWKHKDGKS